MKFNIDYIDKSGDLSHVWVEANNKEDAIMEAKSEYWDIKEIIQVCKSS
jgi:type II secretory pathway component PulF